MNLEEFIRESLAQIARGVRLAAEDVTGTGATINPSRGGVVGPSIKTDDGRYVPVQNIEFDVAVMAADKSQAGGNAGITVAAIVGIRGEKTSSTEHHSESRIKFVVPMALACCPENPSM